MSLSGSFEVDESTQCSLNALTHIDQLISSVDTSYIRSSDKTAVHDQYDTWLCHSYSTVSCFRQVLIHFFKRLVSRGRLNSIKVGQVIVAMDGQGKYSFNRMLAAFLGCVNPRSFLGVNQHQAAMTETVVSRLVNRTAFETEGWKRLPQIQEIFNELGLKDIVTHIQFRI